MYCSILLQFKPLENLAKPVMMEKSYLNLVVKMEQAIEAPNMNTEIESENLEKNESLENGKGKKRETQERKKEKTGLKKSSHRNKNKKLFLNVLFHHLMKAMMTG